MESSSHVITPLTSTTSTKYYYQEHAQIESLMMQLNVKLEVQLTGDIPSIDDCAAALSSTDHQWHLNVIELLAQAYVSSCHRFEVLHMLS